MREHLPRIYITSGKAITNIQSIFRFYMDISWSPFFATNSSCWNLAFTVETAAQHDIRHQRIRYLK